MQPSATLPELLTLIGPTGFGLGALYIAMASQALKQQAETVTAFTDPRFQIAATYMAATGAMTLLIGLNSPDLVQGVSGGAITGFTGLGAFALGTVITAYIAETNLKRRKVK